MLCVMCLIPQLLHCTATPYIVLATTRVARFVRSISIFGRFLRARISHFGTMRRLHMFAVRSFTLVVKKIFTPFDRPMTPVLAGPFVSPRTEAETMFDTAIMLSYWSGW